MEAGTRQILLRLPVFDKRAGRTAARKGFRVGQCGSRVERHGIFRHRGAPFRRFRSDSPICDHTINRRRRIVTFAPGAVFGFIRWAANEHGTKVSRIDILRACADGEPRSTVPGVKPGAEILLRSFGWEKVQRALRAIDAVEALAFAPQEVCPDHWRHVHSSHGQKIKSKRKSGNYLIPA
jgi:hypothetical protein